MPDQWVFNTRSFWVIANRDGVADHGTWKALTDPSCVQVNVTEGIESLLSFSTPEGAEKFIADGKLKGVEPILVGDSMTVVAGFLQVMIDKNVSRIILDPIFGYKNVKSINLENVYRDIIAELDKHAPHDN